MTLPRLSEADVQWSAVRAQGAGGQNVNKVSSAAQLRFDIRASALPEAEKQRLLAWPDGRNNAGSIDPETAAGMASTFGIKVYTIGVGTEGEVPFLADTIFGKRYVYQRVDLDEAILQMIASRTGGTYFKATNTEALAEIYRQIDRMEKTTVETKEYTEYKELFHPFILGGLALLLLEVALTNTRLRRIP